jgi:hypothetical protein
MEEPTFLQRIFGKQPIENAFIALNNLLAEKPVNTITAEDINKISILYRKDVLARFSERLPALYSQYLAFCIQDAVITGQEASELTHLRNLLGIAEKDALLMLHQKAASVYKKEFDKILSDSHLSEAEKERLRTMQASVCLPDDMALKIETEAKQLLIEKTMEKSIEDKRLSEQEEKEFEALCLHLGIHAKFEDATRSQLDRYKLFWTLENKPLPELDVDINLQKGEVCHHTEVVEWLEERTVTKSIRYGGPAVSIRIMKGVYYRAGGYNIEKVTAEEIKYIDSGTLYVTNKRIIFTGTKKNSNIRIDRILYIKPYSDAILVSKDSGKNPVFQVSGNAEILALILGRVINDN